MVIRSFSHHLSGTFITQCPLGFNKVNNRPKISPIESVYSCNVIVPKSLESCEYCSTFPNCPLSRFLLDLFYRSRFNRLAYGGEVHIRLIVSDSTYLSIFLASS